MSKKSKSNTATEKAPEQKVTPKTFTLAKLARDCNKSEKGVRSRFRKLYNDDGSPKDPKSGLPHTAKGGSRWVFNETDRKVITAKVENESAD